MKFLCFMIDFLDILFSFKKKKRKKIFNSRSFKVGV